MKHGFVRRDEPVVEITVPVNREQLRAPELLLALVVEMKRLHFSKQLIGAL